MPASPLITKGTVWQDGDATLLARVRNVSGAYIQQSDISGITVTVRDQNNENAIVTGPTAVTVSSVVFNTLQTDAVLWTVDTTGFNFKHRIAGATAFPESRDYRVTYLFTLTDSTAFPVIFELSAEAVP